MSRGEHARPRLTASGDAPLGGQAVLEGVMMRGVTTWAVAVRAPAAPGVRPGSVGPLGAIEVSAFPLPTRRRSVLRRAPLVRGVLALCSSLAIGLRALSISANAQLPADESDPARPQEISGAMWAGTVIVSLAFAVGLFFVVPVGATSLVRSQLGSSWLFWLVEGAIRTGIFLGYLGLLSRMRELRRVFEYHGAEHKVIACFEARDELTPASAARYSRLHPRCGTSFLLIVMIISIFVFAPIGLPAWWVLVLTRIVGVPVVAGISFEVIKFAGRNRARSWVRWLMAPGLKLQLLTTREPDDAELAVAIAALQAVLAVETPGELPAEELPGLEVVA